MQNVAFGHQALHDTPESLHERLPYSAPDAQLAITSDARLDNREDLFAALSIAPSQRAGIPDSQLLLRAYQKWGIDCATHLLGDFAFAIWDAPRRRMFCARDPLGVRPFYYHLAPHRFVFASDMSAVRAAMQSPDELDLEYLSAFFRNGWKYPHGERTFYAGIRKLKRAHSMIVDGDGMKTWAYWDPENLPEVRMKSDDEYAECLRELLHTAVRARLRSVFRVGAHVSGGLDSSAVAVIAARVLRERGEGLTGYSWAPPPTTHKQTAADERRLVEQVRDLEDIPIHYTTVTEGEVAEWRFRNPGTIHDAGFAHELVVRREARSRGVRVMLSGWGGDELITFNGRGYFADLLRSGRWLTMWRELKMRAEVQGDGVWKPFLNRAIYPLLPDWVIERFRPNALLAGWNETPLPGLLQPDFASRLEAASPLPHKRWRVMPGVRAVQLYLLGREHLPERVEGWASGGQREGIIYAYPLLDRRIVEFSLGLPEEMYFKNGWLRYLFRHALNGILPEEVLWNRNKKEPAFDDDRARTVEKSRDTIRPFVRQLLCQPRDYRYMDGDRVRHNILARMSGNPVEQEGLAGALFVELLVNRELAADVQGQLERLRQEQTDVDCRAA
jgi:asparagine synthase (glutamine-hydrolysing)